MSRSCKPGLDYFPLDVDPDDKIELIEAKYGIEGFGIIVKIFQMIYKNGYYYDASEERLLLLKKRLNVDILTLNAVIEDALRWGLFNPSLYGKYGILTSRGAQKRYVEATKRRKYIEFIEDYLLVRIDNEYKSKVNVNIIHLNADIVPTLTPLNDDTGTQSKVKESKVKKRTPLPPFIDQQVWADFKQHRIALKSKMTPRAEEMAITKLIELHNSGNDVNSIILKSIECGWKGLFEPKGNGKNNPTPNTYAQCQDAEMRDRAERLLREMENDAKETTDGTGKVISLLSEPTEKSAGVGYPGYGLAGGYGSPDR